MKSCEPRCSCGTTTKVRAGVRTPSAKANSKIDAFCPPPTYTRSPAGEIARPSQPSATGTEPFTLPPAVSITLTEGGFQPPFSTSRYLPSGVSALDMGRSEEHTSELQSL